MSYCFVLHITDKIIFMAEEKSTDDPLDQLLAGKTRSEQAIIFDEYWRSRPIAAITEELELIKEFVAAHGTKIDKSASRRVAWSAEAQAFAILVNILEDRQNE